MLHDIVLTPSIPAIWTSLVSGNRTHHVLQQLLRGYVRLFRTPPVIATVDPTAGRSLPVRFSSTPASSAIRLKTRSLPTGCMTTFRPRACVAGLRRTTSGVGGRFMSRLMKPFASTPQSATPVLRGGPGLHDKLLLILSEDSMSSDWVQEELAWARRREVKDGKRMLFPVRLVPFEALEEWECFDADSKKDSAREIREYFIPDFSNWKDHDSYQKAFTRLVADLKAQS